MNTRWRYFFKTRRLKLLTTVLLLSGFLLFYINQQHFCSFTTTLNRLQWNENERDPRFVTIFEKPKSSVTSSTKQILLWTPFFTSLVWDATHNVFQDCPESKCELTTNRHHLTTSDAVLFNVRDLSELTSDPLPSQRSANQVWVLHNTEPPYYVYLPLQKYAGVFNWTSWYRQDATVFSPYGQWRALTKAEKLEKKDNHNFFKKKTKMGLWVSSNCNDKSDRISVVKELQKYIDIDTFGKCGKLKCNHNCRKTFEEYKFYISFENGFCRDYLTEKFWRPVIRNQIPVVRGGADYKSLVPPRSYINVEDFPDIPSLAAYLVEVTSNQTLYNSYFDWKKSYKLIPNGWTRMNWCGLCERLYDSEQPAQVYTDLKGWVQQDSCGIPCKFR